MDVQHDRLEAQVQEFHNTVTAISGRQDEVQTNISEMLKTLATISENQAQNSSFQRMVMEEFRALRPQNSPPPRPEQQSFTISPQPPLGSSPSYAPAWSISPVGPTVSYGAQKWPLVASMLQP
ncbi:hypothetical protein Pyn_23146 [Prunus yedoensis var. nudiflora]|uniref:Uncharacterized protein n=1 Tax=Prunus yedoensis var. nudiflora TaxID=2094558 RepID=A0A314XWW5_PRUYE|nr:hypothetical protein Pyn_23146 [Prunus yedoensis var. nudiflora]